MTDDASDCLCGDVAIGYLNLILNDKSFWEDFECLINKISVNTELFFTIKNYSGVTTPTTMVISSNLPP